MYASGIGVEKNYAEAVGWFQKAADQGVAKAQFNLGLMYGRGDGVKQSDAEARRWLKKAADQGVLEAKQVLEKHFN